MSKFVLCAANCVKIASCHCAFGTVLTFTVTFGRVFVYSLPSSSRACAGGHSNHRNVSVIGLSDSLPVSAEAFARAAPAVATTTRGERERRCRHRSADHDPEC